MIRKVLIGVIALLAIILLLAASRSEDFSHPAIHKYRSAS